MLKLGIIGHPLKHTLSPVLHAKLMAIMGITGEYQAYDTSPESLAPQLAELGSRGLRGLNVTIPHKVTVMPMLDTLSPEARQIGAVNTIVFDDFGQHKAGHNTDVTGFIRSLPESMTQRLPESNMLVLGAGGAARAVLAGLIQLGTAGITLAVRNPQKAMALISDAEIMKENSGQQTQLAVMALADLPPLNAFSGVINTTPIGMWPETEETLLPPIQLETLPTGAWVYDLIYRPLETRLLQDAQALGLHTIGGLDMLIQQGVVAFELWQDQPVPDDLIPALHNHLIAVLQAEIPA